MAGCVDAAELHALCGCGGSAVGLGGRLDFDSSSRGSFARGTGLQPRPTTGGSIEVPTTDESGRSLVCGFCGRQLVALAAPCAPSAGRGQTLLMSAARCCCSRRHAGSGACPAGTLHPTVRQNNWPQDDVHIRLIGSPLSIVL
jgi:hypothetical protein